MTLCSLKAGSHFCKFWQSYLHILTTSNFSSDNALLKNQKNCLSHGSRPNNFSLSTLALYKTTMKTNKQTNKKSKKPKWGKGSYSEIHRKISLYNHRHIATMDLEFRM